MVDHLFTKSMHVPCSCSEQPMLVCSSKSQQVATAYWHIWTALSGSNGNALDIRLIGVFLVLQLLLSTRTGGSALYQEAAGGEAVAASPRYDCGPRTITHCL